MITPPTWNHYLAASWNKYQPPIRPSVNEIEQFRELIVGNFSKLSDISILILGSTPELRDLVSSLGVAPTIVDYSLENYLALGSLCSQKHPEERYWNANWFEIQTSEHFDIVLAEASFNVVEYKALADLSKKVHELLSPRGLLITKIWIRNTDQQPDLENLLTIYRKVQTQRDFYSATCLPLFLHFYHYSRETISLRDFSQNLEELYSRAVLTQAEWKTIARHEYGNVDLALCIPKRQDILNIFSRYFTFEEERRDTVEYSKYHPIWSLRRKAQ